MPGLTDQQMAAMEAPAQERGLTDEEMAAHEHPDSKSVGQKLLEYYTGNMRGLAKGASAGYLDPAKIPGGAGDVIKQDSEAHPIGYGISKAVGAVMGPGKLLGSGVGAIAPEGAGILAGLGRVGANAAGGAAAGAAQNPEEGQSRTGNAIAGGLGGGLASGLAEAGSGIGSKVADTLMKRSVGITRGENPGLGNRLANQGLWGTKNQMANQVEQKLPQAEQRVQDAVNGAGDSWTPNDKIVGSLVDKGKKYLNPDTQQPFPSNEDSYDQVAQLWDKSNQTKAYSPQALLKLKRASDDAAKYNTTGDPGAGFKAELAKAQGDAARGLLDKATKGATAEPLADEGALLSARKGLSKSSANKGIGSILDLLPSSAVESIGGQAAQKGSDLASKVADPGILQALLAAAQSIKGK